MTSTEIEPTAEQWRQLYSLGTAIHKLAPWKKVSESLIFGIIDPETGCAGYVSVMGELGEYFAIGIYLGIDGLIGVLDLQQSPIPPTRVEFLYIPQIQISFEKREKMMPEDIELEKKFMIKKLSGRDSHITFRSIRPGYYPWLISQSEAALLITFLTEALATLPRIIEDPKKFDLIEDEDEERSYFIDCFYRVPEKTSDGVVWRDERRDVEIEEDPDIPVVIPAGLAAAVKKKKKRSVLEIGFNDYPQIVTDDKDRPFLPELMMIADSETLKLYRFDLTTPRQSLDHYYASRIEKVIEAIGELEFRPRFVLIDEPDIYDELAVFAKEAGFKVELVARLSAVEAAVHEFYKRFDESHSQELALF